MVVTISSSHPNSVTIPSSLHAHVRMLAPRLYELGSTVLFQYLAEVVGGASDPLGRLEVYCQLAPKPRSHFGGRNPPPNLRVIK